MYNLQNNIVAIFFLVASSSLVAKPYPNPNMVPVDAPQEPFHINFMNYGMSDDMSDLKKSNIRVQIDWKATSKQFSKAQVLVEKSGTEALYARSKNKDDMGSFQGVLVDAQTGKELYFSSIGTGYYYRELSRALTFRFPMVERAVIFKMYAENDATGVMQEVISFDVEPSTLPTLPERSDVTVKVLQSAQSSKRLLVNIYAEGYTSDREDQFWRDAAKTIKALEAANFPGLETFHFIGVFSPSVEKLGTSRDLGSPVPERNSFLGLYFPYWKPFDRWYHVVYPTREHRYRSAIASAPYDYPIALIDSSSYWGVGNFKELTAIPASASQFSYLLLHEFGHFFGLNEEYESGGPTELAFAPQIPEPWSQNITFQTRRENVKWQSLINPSTPVPTSSNMNVAVGLFKGGYAETPRPSESYKPARQCTMNNAGKFCAVCQGALQARINYDLGSGDAVGNPMGQCACAYDQTKGQCQLTRNGTPISWTPLWDGVACEPSFCKDAFSHSIKQQCR